MARYCRYRGEFLSRAGITWRVDIMQVSDSAFPAVGELTLDSDEALVIEWAEKNKEEVICGSTATLKIESPGDRTYEDLYTIEPGLISLDVYRNGTLYWQGTLDPEFYEEPYERAANYDVTLTFSDFGVFDRLKYDLTGARTLSEIILYALDKASLGYTTFDTMISTGLSEAGAPLTLSDVKVYSDNFYDEDGEPSTLEEVIEGILQPLALRMIQRAGRILVYDLNALYGAGIPEEVQWDGDHQTMSTDKVYNNVRITWSPYVAESDLLQTDCWEGDTDPGERARTATEHLNGRVLGDAKLFSYPYGDTIDEAVNLSEGAGFTMWTKSTGKNVELVDPQSRFFKIVPQLSGEESEGVALYWNGMHFYSESGGRGGIGWQYKAQSDKSRMLATAGTFGAIAFRTPKIHLMAVDNPNSLLLWLSMSALLDIRANFFEQAVDWNSTRQEKAIEERWQKLVNFVYIPVAVKFQPEGSDNVYVWSNRGIVTQTDKAYNSLLPVATTMSDSSGDPIYDNGTLGEWKECVTGADGLPSEWGFLAYYDPSDRQDKPAASGWNANRPAINFHSYPITSALKKADDGQPIPYPAFGSGNLWIEVGTAWAICDDYNTSTGNNPYSFYAVPSYPLSGSFWNDVTWALLRLPELKIRKYGVLNEGIDKDDVEYNAVINPHAREDIELSTICGTAEGGVPAARGAYYNAETGKQITEFSRAGRTTQAEELLIGTLFSQYGERRTTLEGEALILDGSFRAVSEQNQEGKVFLIASDMQNVIMDTSDAKIIELRPDEYDKNV